MPAAMHAKGLARELPAILTVEVDGPCSWSTWQIQMVSSVLTISSDMANCSEIGLENIMQRKFLVQPYSFLGQTMGRPMAVLQAQAAKVGILAINLMASSWRLSGLKKSQSECKKAERAPTTPTMMAIGWASLLKPLQKAMSFSFTIISPTTTFQNFSSSVGEGRQPYSSKQHVSMQLDCSTRSSNLQPRYKSTPFSPSMWVMFEMQLEVHMKPGSQVKMPPFPSKLLTSIIFGPTVPCSTGNSRVLPSISSVATLCFSGSLGVTRSMSRLDGSIN